MNKIRGRVFRIVGLIALIFSLSAVASASYTTVNFNYKNWGSFYTVPYAGEQYFAGYLGGGALTSTNIITFDSASNSGQMHMVLMNDNTSRVVAAGSTFTLNENYVLKVKDVDITGGKIALLSLLKNGNEVDTTAISEGGTYLYTKKVGDIINLPLIAFHISNVSVKSVTIGTIMGYLTIDGIFQISEGFIKVTTTNGSSSYVTVTPVISTPFRTPTPTKGSISVSSSPSGASIYLDSVYQGVTPKTLTDISIGSHYLELTLEGYKPWSDSIDVREGFTSYPSIPLMLAPTSTITPTHTPNQTISATVTQISSPIPTITSPPKTAAKEAKEPLNKIEGFKDEPSWLESAINSIIDWLKSLI